VQEREKFDVSASQCAHEITSKDIIMVSKKYTVTCPYPISLNKHTQRNHIYNYIERGA
jgi:hypothetical protein